MQEKDEKWFESWFNTKYYHILYKNRDYSEAKDFVDKLVEYLDPKKDAYALDLACGSGRHAIRLASHGLNVTGTDLSAESIKEASKSESDNLEFYIQDMRESFRINYFNYIFNLFTSFGYFETQHDHLKTLKNIRKGLKSDGTFVFDFFNAPKVIANLKLTEEKTIDGITFHIKRFIKKGKINKSISFTDEGKDYHFTETVHAFDLDDYQNMFKKAGLKIVKQFGNYNLDAYDEDTSDRLILIASK